MDSFFENLLKDNGEIVWASYSYLDVVSAIKTVSAWGDIVGIQLHPGDGYIQSNGFNIRFHEKDHGCDLHIYIFKDTKDSSLFIRLWAALQSERKILGGKYKKEFQDLINKLQLEKHDEREPASETSQNVTGQYEIKTDLLNPPWDNMPDANEDEINLVKIWCTESVEGEDLARKTRYASPGNALNRLRTKYPDAGIPLGKIERKKFRDKYLKTAIKARAIK